MRRTFLISAAFSLTLPCLAPAAPADPDLASGLDALRSGRFEEARASFSRMSSDRPEAPDGPFFEAFGLWWQLLYRPDDAALRHRMEDHLAEAARRARALRTQPEGPDRSHARVYLGAAMLLDAQSKAARGAWLSAVSSARQGHRALTQALEADPGDVEALFNMGAYNYYADHLPALVKGIRFLLFVPGGDGARGIAQLERAAAGSLFDVEALMLLAHIYTGAFEEDYARALGYVERAVSRCPRSPLVALARADLLYSMGSLREAEAAAVDALKQIHGEPGYPPELARALVYRTGACALGRHDPIGALERIEGVLSDLGAPGAAVAAPPEKKQWLTLWAEAARKSGRVEGLEGWIQKLGVPDEVAAPLRRRAAAAAGDPLAAPRAAALHRLAAGDPEGGFAAIRTLAGQNPADLRLRYDLGRLLQQRGDIEGARPHLLAVAGAARSSPAGDLSGWALLRLGWDLDRQDRHDEAAAYYRRAADLGQFPFRPAALDRIARPSAAPPPGGAPPRPAPSASPS